MLLFFLMVSIQTIWAQTLTADALKATEICDFGQGNISYTLPSDQVSEGSNCIWTVKINDQETTEGKTVTDDTRTLTLKLSNQVRTVEVSYTDANNSPQTLSFEVEPKKYGSCYGTQNFYADKYAGGSGTKEDPFQISSAMELAKLQHDVTYGKDAQMFPGKYFTLTQDIDLSQGLWMPIGTLNTTSQHFFAGILDGDGKAIRNMKINWNTNGTQEASWGLFSRLNGKDKDHYATVTNLVIEKASIETAKGVKPSETGTVKIGIVAGDLTNFAEVSNIIIRNSKITDQQEKYTVNNTCRIGGIIGYTDAKNYRIFNLMSDTEIDLHKNATINKNKKITIAGGIGLISTLLRNNNSILPTNIYISGKKMQTAAKTDKYATGYVVSFYGSDYVKNLPDANKNTLYYSEETPNATYNIGTQKDIAAFGKEFAEICNSFATSQQLEDKKTWIFSDSENQYAFSNISLKLERGKTDVLKVVEGDGSTESKDLYAWYVSADNQSWTQASTTASSTYTLPRDKEYNQYVYAAKGNMRTGSILVEAIHVEASLATHDNTYTVSVKNDTREGFSNEALGLSITYEWYNGDTRLSEISETSATFTRPTTASYNDKYSCKVTVKTQDGNILLKDYWLNATTVVFLDPTHGDDANDGYTTDKPMKTWKGAYSKLSEKGTWDENIIVLMSESSKEVTNNTDNGFNITPNNTRSVALTLDDWNTAKNKSPLFRNVTITGKYGNYDYQSQSSIEIKALDIGLPLWGDTRFENITFKNTSEGSDTYKNIFCQYNNLEMGEGIQMKGFNENSKEYGTLDGAVTTPMQIFGGFNNDGRYAPLDTPERIKAFENSMPHGKEGFHITIKSGYFSAICVGGRQTIDKGLNGVMGTPNQPIKCTITLDIDRKWNDAHNETKTIKGAKRTNDYDAGIILAGNHEGAMFADVDIIVRSGKVARIVNGTLGAQRPFTLKYQDKIYNVPLNTFMGRAHITLDPASSKNNSDKNINNRVIVTELYGGSMGRGHTGKVTINNPFYGYSTITINGGTFKTLPKDNTQKDKIFSGIFGAGAGGMNGIGSEAHHTSDESIPYWNTSKDVMLYGNYDEAKNSLISYHCYNAEKYTYTYVDPLKTHTSIQINGGVFGSEAEKIDGIYAGGSGYMSKGLWTSNDATPSTYGGNVYGYPGENVVSLTINDGTFHCQNGIFAGGRGTDFYYATNPYGGTASQYTALGQTYGNVMLNIYGGEFHCPIFGGGYGVADAKEKTTGEVTTLSDMALVKGKTQVNINGGTFFQNIYGGGDMARVESLESDATQVVIGNDADIRASVFGGGNGRKRRPSTLTFAQNDGYTQNPKDVGKVTGITNVTFTGNTQSAPKIYGDIYGGGNLAQVKGSTNVNIFAAHFAGQIFGGGKGYIPTDANGQATTNTTEFTSADVIGNTYVTLAQDMGGQEEGDDGTKKDNFSINVIWNQKWNAEEQKFITWIPKDGTNKNLFFDSDATSETEHFLNPHNIYGGGNLACEIQGSAVLEIFKGMTPFDLLNTDEWKKSYTDNDNPHFSVFGGGYGEHTTVANTDVTVNVEGDYGVYNAEVDDETDQLARPHKKQKNRANKSKARANSSTTGRNTSLPIFDNSKGIPNFTILGVLGGGYAGTVTGSTKVVVDGPTFVHRVYGGGFGDPTKDSDNSTGKIGTGTESAHTEVFVRGAFIYGDVFGGGAGVAPKTLDGNQFKNVARVDGTTMVEISDDAKIYGNVYGGGDMAVVGSENYTADYSIKPVSETEINAQTGEVNWEIGYQTQNRQTLVNIIGGDIYGAVYGGGKGLTKVKANTNYDQVGRINGNTIVHVCDTKNNAQGISIDYDGNTVPYIWGDIYGGCAYGTVDGNTLVHIEGGMLGHDIFGGGYGEIELSDQDNETAKVLGKKAQDNEATTYANILGNTQIQMDGGTWLWNRMADGNGNITTWLAANTKAEKICNDLNEFKQLVKDIYSVDNISELPEGKAKTAIQKILNDEDTQKFFRFTSQKLTSGSFTVNNNIYGGGNRACYVGTYQADGSAVAGTGEAKVIINHSPLADITDMNGYQLSIFDYTTLPALCWYMSCKNTSDPQFSVFGAGYGANTKVAKASVYAEPGSRIAEKGILEKEGLPKYRYLNQPEDYQTYINFEKNLYADFLKISKEDKKYYYGSATGGNADGSDDDPQTYQRYRISRLAWNLGLPGFTFQTIHGGGFSGYVTGDTYVETDCQLCAYSIFGAGLGAVPYNGYDKNGEAAATSADGNADFGSVGGNSKVFIKAGYVAGNIYGGGAGIDSRLNGNGGYTDFTKMAHVNKTEVHIYGRAIPFQVTGGIINRTIVMGNIYGGGDVANVGNTKAEAAEFTHDNYLNENNRTTLVNIRGGALYAGIFAGGKGRLKSQCQNYESLGSIYGNTCLIADRPNITYPYWNETSQKFQDPADPENMAHPADNINTGIRPHLIERLYGGGENGTIYGNTLVVVNDASLQQGIYGGGLGRCDSLTINNEEKVSITSADITGNTNVLIYGGEAQLNSYWRTETRSWEPTSTIDGTTYSPQYDHEARKFKINHNIYAGGNVACVVEGNTHITMAKGILYKNTKVTPGQDDNINFFETNEWKEIYNKVGSPHFCVFGGGYGENTIIKGNTDVNIAMIGRGSKIDPSIDLKEGEEYKHFWSGYSVMDFVGGGYSGKVEGETYVTGDGGAFCRRLFGGGFYNSVKATHVDIRAMDCRDIFGGGMMGDVEENTKVSIGIPPTSNAYTDKDIFIHGNVYGGNDVSGYVNVKLDESGYFTDNGGLGTQIRIYGGKIDGDVYGAGNGDYLYALDRKGNTQVTVNENYPLNPNDPQSETTPLVFTVPMRDNMPSYKTASDAAKLVNINSWRPLTNKVDIQIEGKSSEASVLIKGNVYGGGNSATVLKVQGKAKKQTATEGDIKIKIGSYVNIKGVFMGCNGDALFTATEDNDFMNKFQRLNGDYEDASKELDFSDSIDWVNDPSNRGISTLYLPTEAAQRPLIYPHLIDLYFQPVEMNIQGKLDWGDNLTQCTIGSFYCGGNRGNMNVYPNADGKVVDYTFPKGLTITDKIVGGCNNANYDYKGKATHEGGYLLGMAHSTKPFIHLTIQNQFDPKVVDGAYHGGCVYGGCYESGTVIGDIKIDLQSDMLAGKSKSKLEAANEKIASNPEFSSLNVYGAGYGMESYVYGITRIMMGEGIKCSEPKTENGVFQPCGVKESTNTEGMGVSANFLYGGGQQGNVIGTTNVEVFNGHIFRSATGGSYSGYVYGSTTVKAGYPIYYKVKHLKSGRYELNRTDQHNINLKNNDGEKETPTIKQEICLLEDDYITQGVYDDIVAIEYNGTKKDIKNLKSDYFDRVNTTPEMGWDNVNITIGEAIYGGGYSLAQGSSVLANNTTVLKFTKKYNVDEALNEEQLDEFPNNTSEDFGGNTMILVGDNKEKEHITISQQDMKEIPLPDGTDLYGYYYRHYSDKNSKKYTYRYISQPETYYKSQTIPDGLATEMKDNIFYEYDSEGGIFGDGHLSYAQGFRSADITGYGFAEHTIEDPKIINTFQRLDILRLEDNCFTLLGARDYTVNEINKTPYSIARVGEVKMVAGDGIVLTNNKLQTRPSTADKYSAKARNYIGLVNNIHYVGAVLSNVAFTDTWFDETGKASAENKSYKDNKQTYINAFNLTDRKDVTEFQKRNNGTAKNMMGIASGYALKIQNVQEIINPDTKKMKEVIYYGPIYGVVEMNLIYVRPGEGGGYVYADNIHKRTDGKSDFLETTGNFVFPTNMNNQNNNRYIIDDCSPTGFYAMNGADPDQTSEIHYWYVTGYHYYYNAHITGYTYKKHIFFNNDNADGLTALAGLKAGQKITLKSWKMRSGHADRYECDLEKGHQDKEGKDTSLNYKLFVGASSANKYDGPTQDSEGTGKGFYAELSMKPTQNADGEEEYKTNIMNDQLAKDMKGDAKITFRLDDYGDNSDPEYYKKYLSNKCQATLELEADALDETGKPKQDASTGETLKYIYTIYLTIEYVQGPTFTGNITIDNCALPGEMIRLKKDQVKISADQAFAANGYFWHIGKLKKDNNGKTTTEFDEKESWLLNTKDSENTYKQGDDIESSRKDLFAGSIYDKTNDYLDIPAYYFMNGYGVQLGITMNGFEETVFPVNMAAGDTLVVHNYHEMDPHKNGINLHLKEAIQRAKEEASFAEPRIYINDQKDLSAFGAFIQDKDNAGGEHAQFILQNDLTLPADYTGGTAIFKGTLHGNGHIIQGINTQKSLFAQNQGNIYNLGLTTGNICATSAADGGTGYHACFEMEPASGKPIVYGIDGKKMTYTVGSENREYTLDDFKYGRVAYDLNGYYLRARQGNESKDDKAALKYVYDYYANGDYQYAQRTDAITGNNTGIIYLRTGKDSNLPNYGKTETRHDKTHAIDQVRGIYTEATAEKPAEFTGVYQPIFGTGQTSMNDFLFWGQSLQSTPADYPSMIASRQVKYMTNRVYRTDGYYGNTIQDKFHYNAYKLDSKRMGTYVHIPTTTAINLAAQDDNASSFSDFTVKEGVTQNLLVYTGDRNEANDDNTETGKQAYDIVKEALTYTETTAESQIQGHHIVKYGTKNPTYSTPLLHLVERTPAGENSKGESCDNNDLCVPIAFEVTQHAWYIRKPMYYANEATGAWEGITLPFTAEKVVASLNGEITHFYGNATEEEVNNPDKNTHTLHHEYWLRGLTAVNTNGDAASGSSVPAATFQRPGSAAEATAQQAGSAAGATEGGLFHPSAAESMDYLFLNRFFVDTYGGLYYNKENNPYYDKSHTFKDYQLLSANVPYVVRFPGERYYEFDLSSKFYNNLKNSREEEQTITFNAYGKECGDADVATSMKSTAIQIPITDHMATDNINGYAHQGTFAAMEVAKESVYGMNADGTAFSDASTLATVMPFRTYMAPASQNARMAGTRSTDVPSEIRIAETTGIDKIQPEIQNQDEDNLSGDNLIVRPIGSRRVRIESSYATQLKVFAATGMLYRILDVQPGTATYSGFYPGLYIFGQCKVMVK